MLYSNQSTPVYIFIVSSYRLQGSALAALLQAEPTLRVVGQADIMSVPLLNLWSEKPDMILVDIDQPEEPDWHLLSEVCWECRELPVVALSYSEAVATSPRLLELGVHHCLSKLMAPTDFFAALRSISSEKHLPAAEERTAEWRSLAATAGKVRGLFQLTDREREMVGLLLQGLRVRAIAEKLHLTEQTVRNYTSAIYAKLGVNSKAELIARYHRQIVNQC